MKKSAKKSMCHNAAPGRLVQRGLTVVELMVGLTVVSIMAVVGAPNLSNFVADQRRVTSTNEFLAALNLARSEALSSARHVSVCRSSDGANCTNGGNDWTRGWIVFANTARNNVGVRDADETVLRVFDALDGKVQFQSPDGLNGVIAFRPTGDLDVAGTIVYCDKRGAKVARAVVVERSGRARVAGENFDGSPLGC